MTGVYRSCTSPWRYVVTMWPLLLVLGMAQVTMRLTGNTESIGLSPWMSLVDSLLFLVLFGAAALWTQAPLVRHARRLHRQKEGRERIVEMLVAELPWRALRAFGLAGFIFGSYLLVLMLVAAAVQGTALTPRMIAALAICFYFAAAVLAPTLALANTLAYTIRVRHCLTRAGVFLGSLDDARPEVAALTGSARRPWLLFFATGLIPAALLAIYVMLALGVDDAAEQRFIFAQALVFFVISILASVDLVYTISRSLKRVTEELCRGLKHLGEGRFDGQVPVLVDDDLGELARGLNTALRGLKEREDLKDSLRIAAEIQEGLLPRTPPDVPGYGLRGFQKSCFAVGGDYYDHIVLPDGRLWLVMADVAGKGYPAALTVANLQAMLHALASLNLPFEKAASYINDTLCETMTGGRFVTMFMAKLQPVSHSMLWLNAGHVPPMFARGGEVEMLEASSPPMGVQKGISFKVSLRVMDPGALLFAYTDGLTEMRDREGGEMFGEARLKSWLLDHLEEPAARLPEALMRRLEAFGSERCDDDLTLLCAKREGTS